MKKNLNIAYLNGAEGMIRRGASGGSGSCLKYLPKYYSIDWSVADEGWREVLTDGNSNRIAATFNGGLIISAYIPPFDIKAFSFLPVGFISDVVIFFETLESVIGFYNGANTAISLSMNGIKEISEEEYYSFDNNNGPQ